MIETVEELTGSVQDTGTLNTSLGEQNTLIGNLDSVGNIIREEDVNFYDYTGDLLYSYKRNDFLALNEMPSTLLHSHLISQGWNWDLQEAKEYVERNGCLDIGEIYDTYNKGTIIGIELETSDELDLTVSLKGGLYYQENEENLVLEGYVDWGDGSNLEIVTPDEIYENLGYFNIEHVYENIGKYEIIFYTNNDIDYYCELAEHSLIKYEHIGSGFVWENDEWIAPIIFSSYSNLEYVTIANYTISYFPEYLFSFCSNLKTIIVPKGVSSISSGCIRQCLTLQHLILSNTVEYIYLDSQDISYSRLNKIHIPTNCNECRLDVQYKDIDMYFPNKISSLELNMETYNCDTLKFPDIVSYFFSVNLSLGYSKLITLPSSPPVNMNDLIIEFDRIEAGKYLTIPSYINNINSNFNIYLFDIRKIYFIEHTQVPVLQNINYFTIDENTIIVVPDILYNDWCNATNWINYRSQIKKASEVQ